MINKLFKFYNKKLTFDVMMSKGIKRKRIDLFITSAGAVCFLVLLFFNELGCFTDDKSSSVIWHFGAIAILIGIVSFRIKRDVTLIKMNRPKLYLSFLKWDIVKYDKIRVKKLKKVLKDFDDSKLNLIQVQIEIRKKSAQLTFVIRNSVFGLLILPIWSVFVGQVLNSTTFLGNEYYILLIVLLILIVFVIIISPFIYSLRDHFITDAAKWNDLNKLITELRLKKPKKSQV